MKKLRFEHKSLNINDKSLCIFFSYQYYITISSMQ